MSHHVHPIDIVFGTERTRSRRRARLTGEKKWRAKDLRGRGGSLGLDPVEAGQIRFQAFLAWSLWGDPTSPLDPGGHSRRALLYSFTHSQGPNFWELGGVDRYSDNLPRQFIGAGAHTPGALPGFRLEEVSGRLISLAHEPTGGCLRARVGSDVWLGDEPHAGAWNPVRESHLSYAAMPDLTDEASALLASVLSRVIGLDRALLAFASDHRDQRHYDDLWGAEDLIIRNLAANAFTLDTRSGSHAIPYELLEAIFTLPGLAPPGTRIERHGPYQGVLHRGDAMMWIIGSPTATAS